MTERARESPRTLRSDESTGSAQSLGKKRDLIKMFQPKKKALAHSATTVDGSYWYDIDIHTTHIHTHTHNQPA